MDQTKGTVPGIDSMPHAGVAPVVAALFDMDNTVLRSSSTRLLLRFLVQEGYLGWGRRLGLAARAGLYLAGLYSFPELLAYLMSGIAGGDQEAVWRISERWSQQVLQHEITAAARDRIAWHLAQGHRVLIISAAAAFAVRPVSRSLGLESNYLATQLEVAEGKLTGRVIEPACYGAGKVAHAQAYAAQHKIDLARSYFYTDSHRDLPLLEAVGHPVAVNPDGRLARIAAARGWRVLRFS